MAQVDPVVQEQLISEEVSKNIENLIKQQSIKNYVIDISVGSTKGDNYLGIITKVVVDGEDSDGNKKRLNLIVKSAPRTGFMRSFMPMLEVYKREIYAYSTIFAEFAKFQKVKNIEKPFNSVAKFYASLIDESNEVLILEDMKVLGYRLWERRDPYDYNHALIAVREYGKLHALSFAIRDQKPQLFQKLTENLEDIVIEQMFRNKETNEAFKSLESKYLECLDPIKDKVAYDKLAELMDTIIPVVKVAVTSEAAGKYAVIGHGDCWINNFLYKYENKGEPSRPTKVIILDWQLMRLGSPALDFCYLIFSSTDKKLRDEHYEDLVAEYYHSLSSHLIALGSDPKVMFPYEILQEHLKKFAVYGLYMSMGVLMAATSEVEDLPNVHSDEINIDNLANSFLPPPKTLDKYSSRVKGIVLDCIKYNYI